MPVTAILGPMMSGKSTQLLRYLERSIRGNKKVCLIRPMIDDRDFFSHSKGTQTIFDSLSITTYYFGSNFSENFNTYTSILENYNVLGIDEVQFLDHAVSYISGFINRNKTVYVSGLLATSENKVFPNVLDILPFCDYIEKLSGVCTMCGSDIGNYTYYKEGEKHTDIIVGGADKYTVICGQCLMGGKNEYL